MTKASRANSTLVQLSASSRAVARSAIHSGVGQAAVAAIRRLDHGVHRVLDRVTSNLSPATPVRKALSNNAILPAEVEAALLYLRRLRQAKPQLPKGPTCSVCCGDATAELGTRSQLSAAAIAAEHDRLISYCFACGIFFVTPSYDDEATAALYASDYRATPYSAETEPNEYCLTNEPLIAARIATLINLNRSLGEGAGRRCLEIGSYTGLMQVAFMRLGYDCVGIEPSAAAAALARKVVRAQSTASVGASTIIDGFFESTPLDGLFDVIYSAHVIEHVRSPRDFLKQAASLLHPNGLIVFETPLFEQEHERYSTRFKDIYHMHFLTVRGVAELSTVSALEVAGLHQITYQFRPGMFSNSVIAALRLTNESPAALARTNLQTVLDWYEDSVRRQVLLALAADGAADGD